MNVTTKQIAEALGVTPSAILKRTKKDSWQPLGRVCPGGYVYDLFDPFATTITRLQKYRIYDYFAINGTVVEFEKSYHAPAQYQPEPLVVAIANVVCFFTTTKKILGNFFGRSHMAGGCK